MSENFLTTLSFIASFYSAKKHYFRFVISHKFENRVEVSWFTFSLPSHFKFFVLLKKQITECDEKLTFKKARTVMDRTLAGELLIKKLVNLAEAVAGR